MTAVLTACFAVGALAQDATSTPATTSTTDATSLLDTLKTSPFSLSFAALNEVYRDDNFHPNTVASYIDAFIGYKLTKNDDLRLWPEISVSKKESEEMVATFELLELRYRRKNILTEADNGVSLTGELRYAFFPDSKAQDGSRRNGYVQSRFSFVKNFTEKFSTLLQLRQYVHLRRTGVNGARNPSVAGKAGEAQVTRALEYRAYLIPSYQVNDWLSTSLGFLYFSRWNQRVDRDSIQAQDRRMILEPGVNVTLSDAVNFDLYIDFTPYKSNDGRKVAKDWNDSTTVGLGLNVTAF